MRVQGQKSERHSERLARPLSQWERQLSQEQRLSAVQLIKWLCQQPNRRTT
nr:MAG TPA: hypothetical protein [Caudoviricetes sp.]